MKFNQVIEKLKQEFKILEILDISLSIDIIYSRLANVRKNRFEPDEKILILQKNPDTYEYIDYPGQQLANLQKCLSDLDISNSFVTIITGNPDINVELEQVRRQLSVDNLPMQSIIVDVDNNYNKIIKKYQDTYCVLPWMHLYIGTTGDVLPCCMADQNLPLGNVFNNSIDKIMTSSSAQQLKLNMLQGYRSKSCNFCYSREDNNLPSLRIKNNHQFEKYKSIDVEQYRPVYLDIRINNICNFKCRMCNEWFSSSIAQETKKIYGPDAKLPYHYIDIESLDHSKRSTIIEEILNFVTKDIERIYFAGGEPLLAQEHYSMLQKLIDIGHTDVPINYNTNMSVLQFKNISVIELWKKFSNVTVGASIDASGAVAEYVRNGTIWNDIIKNINSVKEQCPHVNLKITSTVGFLNCKNLMQLQRDWISTEYLPAKSFEITCLTSPNFLSLGAIPKIHKKRLQHEIEIHIAWLKNNDAISLASSWQNMLNYMINNNFSYSLKEFKNRMLVLDQSRNESFSTTFPEYVDLI
jgi:MoaA/NifB/PqqE/SkfB family radical SAM enzyme